MKVRFKKLHPSAVAPTKAHDTDAGFDLTATSRKIDDNGCIVYSTGVAVEIPKGHVGLVFPRSSIAEYDLALSNAVGVIDSGYRGEIMAKFKPSAFLNTSPRDIMGVPAIADFRTGKNARMYEIGDRIGQLIILPIPEIEFEESEELSDSDRGDGGYGSSGR